MANEEDPAIRMELLRAAAERSPYGEVMLALRGELERITTELREIKAAVANAAAADGHERGTS